MHPNSVLNLNNSIEDDSQIFWPKTMFSLNCVADCALIHMDKVEENQIVEFYQVLENLPQVIIKNSVMIKKVGIRTKYPSIQHGGKIGSKGKRKHLECVKG